MIKGRFAANVVIDFHIDDEVAPNMKEFSSIRDSVTNGDLAQMIKCIIADEMDEKNGLATVHVEQQYADLYETS